MRRGTRSWRDCILGFKAAWHKQGGRRRCEDSSERSGSPSPFSFLAPSSIPQRLQDVPLPRPCLSFILGLYKKGRWILNRTNTHILLTLNSPTTEGSSFSSDLPRYNLNVSEKSVRPSNSATFSSSQLYI